MGNSRGCGVEAWIGWNAEIKNAQKLISEWRRKFWLIDWIVNAGVHNLHNNLTSTDSDHWDSGPWKWFGVAQL